MTVVYVSDDNYAHLLGISLTSLYENNKDVIELNVFIIDDGISDRNKKKIYDTARRFGREVCFFIADISISNSKMGKWPKNIFYRLYFVSAFGDKLSDERVLYLDCDTIVADSIQELWNTNLGGKACAAVYECIGDRHKKKCMLGKSLPYFNSGVLLMDVQKWKEINVENKVLQILGMNCNTKMEYPDEGIINYLLKENIKPLSPRYNLTTIKCVFSYKELKMYRKSRFMYSEKEYIDAKNEPCIIHYTNNFLVRRPWQSGDKYSHPLEKYFVRYKNDSEWKDIETPQEHVGLLKKIVRILFGINGMLCVVPTGFIYSYIKPLKYDKLIVSKEDNGWAYKLDDPERI
ncbi:glycosyltransferase family 8 protein [Butyrivibrio sp. MC2013]|uniref:glycosyltransferase family 8 protein n=1 Tax=Butyrivibrio sp. MC2013 TaxID=1280686 RepID=UPI000419FCA7|nr:glycosyltransferase family 8 protein [Butyrivibrio sp. MC2013]